MAFRPISPPAFGPPKPTPPPATPGDGPAAPAGHYAAAGLTRRHAMLAEVAVALPDPPRPGESVHFLLDRRWEMAAVLVGLCTRPGPKVAHLRIATLSIGLKQLADLLRLADAGTVARLTLVASDYFANADKEIFGRVQSEFGKRGFRVAAPRCHAKVACIDYADGACLVTEGSANLRANKNFEQIAVVNDRGLHDFHAGWIDTVIDQYATV